jgi:formate hydrogenlyase subunit 4
VTVGDLVPMLSLAIVLAIAPAITGIATRTKALLTGRRGAPVLQLSYDLWKLARRSVVYGHTTTVVFRLAPVLAVATVLCAALLLPLDGHHAVLSFSGDAVAFAYLLGLGRFFLILGALDTGSSFEGMGASREAAFATFVECGLFLSLAPLSVISRDLSLSGMLGAPLAEHWALAVPALFMVAASVFTLLLAECSRVPVDDPATHLELTMVHEVMVLDHSGPDLALIVYAGAVKLALFGALVASVLVPRGMLPPVASLAALLGGIALVGVGIGVVESTVARLRLPKVPLYIVGASAFGLFGLALVLR